MANKCLKVSGKKFVEQGLHGKAIKDAINQESIHIIQSVKNNFNISSP